MKKFLLIIATTALSLSLGAQTVNIKPVLQKGLTATYETETQINTSAPQGGSELANTKYTTTYTVEDVNTDSAVIVSRITNVDMPKEALNEAATLIKGLQDVDFRISTELSGKPRNILNYSEVRGKVVNMLKGFIDEQFNANPALDKAASKDDLYGAIEKQIDKNYLLEQVEQDNVLKLAGESISSGQTEQTEVKGIKLSTTYTVGNVLGITTVSGSVKSAMTKEDVKNAFFKQLDGSGLSKEQIEQTKSQWGMIEASGMAKMEIVGNNSYHFGTNLWPTDITSTSESTVFGATINTTSKTKLTSHSWK